MSISDHVQITSGQPGFSFVSGLMVVPRAALEISLDCPDSIKLALSQAVAKGYIKAVAYVPEAEYIMDRLKGR